METGITHILYSFILIQLEVELNLISSSSIVLAVSHANPGVPFVFLFRDSLGFASLPAATQCIPGTVLIRW